VSEKRSYSTLKWTRIIRGRTSKGRLFKETPIYPDIGVAKIFD